MPIHSTYDFEELFTMELPRGQNYWNVAWCHPNGGLGCHKEYWERDAGCEINPGEVVIYYYDTSLLPDGQSNVGQYAVNVLTTSYLYYFYKNDGDLVVLRNDIGMTNVPQYLVGTISEDGSEAVFVGGYDLGDLKEYARSVEFN